MQALIAVAPLFDHRVASVFPHCPAYLGTHRTAFEEKYMCLNSNKGFATFIMALQSTPIIHLSDS